MNINEAIPYPNLKGGRHHAWFLDFGVFNDNKVPWGGGGGGQEPPLT